ncbi:MAG TPA: type 4a pilus biogenesis protein PilO [bacterium]
MVKGLSREKRIALVVAALGIVILGIYAMGIVGPLWRKSADLGQKVRQAREQLKTLRSALDSESVLRRDYQQLRQQVKAWEDRLPSVGQLPSVLEDLSGFANTAGVKIQTIVPRAPTMSTLNPPLLGVGIESPYQGVPVQIEATAGVHQLGAFLSLIEGHGVPMDILGLRVSGDTRDPYRHRINLVIRPYLSVNEPASASGPPVRRARRARPESQDAPG